MKPTADKIYFLAEGEAKTQIESFIAAATAHLDAARELVADLGGTLLYYPDGRAIGGKFQAPPNGWKKAPNRMKMGHGCFMPPKGFQWPMPYPNRAALEDQLGIKREAHFSMEHGLQQASYGYSVVGSHILVAAQKLASGNPLGGAPVGCRSLAMSEVWALVEAHSEAQ